MGEGTCTGHHKFGQNREMVHSVNAMNEYLCIYWVDGCVVRVSSYLFQGFKCLSTNT